MCVALLNIITVLVSVISALLPITLSNVVHINKRTSLINTAV